MTKLFLTDPRLRLSGLALPLDLVSLSTVVGLATGGAGGGGDGVPPPPPPKHIMIYLSVDKILSVCASRTSFNSLTTETVPCK
jgi:hypothetical protein